MRSRTLVAITVGGLAIALAGCKKGSSTPTSPSGSGGSTTTTTITIPLGDGYGNSSFAPGNVQIAVGGRVAWQNRDTVVHNTSSNNNSWASDIAPGAEYTRTFTASGTFAYRCAIHPGMTGTITVQ